MATYSANITLMIDVFDATDGVHAGDIVNDYVTRLANAMSDFDLVWNDCDFVVYEIEEAQ